MEELPVGASPDLIDHGGLEVEHKGTGHVLPSTSLGEEGVEGVILDSDGLVGGHRTVRLNTVLQAVQLPARVTRLDTGLAEVDGDDFTHSGLLRSV